MFQSTHGSSYMAILINFWELLNNLKINKVVFKLTDWSSTCS